MNRESPSVPPLALSLPHTDGWARWWAVCGVALTFVEAIVRLGSRALGAAGSAEPLHYAVFVGLAATLTYFEGYRALQQRFVPGVVARAAELRASSPLLMRCLAPLYACALVGAERKTLLRAWSGVFAIVLAVVLVRHLPPLWRATVDGAVAAALTWGLSALLLAATTRRARHVAR